MKDEYKDSNKNIVLVTFYYIFRVEIFYARTITGLMIRNNGSIETSFVTKETKDIQKHYITIRCPVKSGRGGGHGTRA